MPGHVLVAATVTVLQTRAVRSTRGLRILYIALSFTADARHTIVNDALAIGRIVEHSCTRAAQVIGHAPATLNRTARQAAGRVKEHVHNAIFDLQRSTTATRRECRDLTLSVTPAGYSPCNDILVLPYHRGTAGEEHIAK